jgi:hypothetical protein
MTPSIPEIHKTRVRPPGINAAIGCAANATRLPDPINPRDASAPHYLHNYIGAGTWPYS